MRREAVIPPHPADRNDASGFEVHGLHDSQHREESLPPGRIGRPCQPDPHRRPISGSRTYNFPENRIADHRVGFKAHNLDQVLDGDMDALFDALAAADKQSRLQQA